MKESTYAPKFEELVKHAGRQGISTRDLSDGTGSSREQAYQWVRQMTRKGKLREIGENGKRAKLLVWQEQPTRRPRVMPTGERVAGHEATVSVSAVEVGTTFTVSRLRWEQGKVIAVLTGPGAEIEAELT